MSGILGTMGTLYIVATPIGNLEDITLRALRILKEVDIIACEDTRHTGLLLSKLHIPAPKLIPYYDEVEQKRAPELLELLEAGSSIALVSDAGTPLISDPGYLLVSQALKSGIKVVSIPGPSAVIAALSISGLPANTFMFLGYPPEKQSHRKKLFTSLLQCFKTLEQKPTCIFYCAPHKLEATLVDMKEAWGDIEIVICRELTKQFEETWKGTISEALLHKDQFKGELVLLKG